ncbi:MAG: membrane protein insertion efficiency factor YidD [Peptostreptococcaceae bacterium]|nr:membrane protein insertion efficiency factor YidD [Peptostreptococcaceae bacterium]
MRTIRKKIRRIMTKIMILLIRFYQKYISPLKRPSCRFYPTCSSYAIQAYKKYGFFKGSVLSIWRILRCNPFCKGGYDPVK